MFNVGLVLQLTSRVEYYVCPFCCCLSTITNSFFYHDIIRVRFCTHVFILHGTETSVGVRQRNGQGTQWGKVRDCQLLESNLGPVAASAFTYMMMSHTFFCCFSTSRVKQTNKQTNKQTTTTKKHNIIWGDLTRRLLHSSCVEAHAEL